MVNSPTIPSLRWKGRCQDCLAGRWAVCPRQTWRTLGCPSRMTGRCGYPGRQLPSRKFRCVVSVVICLICSLQVNVLQTEELRKSCLHQQSMLILRIQQGRYEDIGLEEVRRFKSNVAQYYTRLFRSFLKPVDINTLAVCSISHDKYCNSRNTAARDEEGETTAISERSANNTPD